MLVNQIFRMLCSGTLLTVPREYYYPVRSSITARNNKIPQVREVRKVDKQEEELDWLERVDINNVSLLLLFFMLMEDKE